MVCPRPPRYAKDEHVSHLCERRAGLSVPSVTVALEAAAPARFRAGPGDELPRRRSFHFRGCETGSLLMSETGVVGPFDKIGTVR